MKKTNIKISHCVIGLPMLPLLICIGLSFAFSYFVYPAFLMLTIISLVVCYAIKKVYFKNYELLVCDLGGPMRQQILVKGLPSGFFKILSTLIKSNRLLVVKCPKSPFLRKAISDFVYNKAGFVEFETSHDIEVIDKDLGKRAVLLSYHSKKVLQDSISHLLNRGWKLSGQQGMESNLIDRVYTQRMIYDPNV